MPERAQGEDAVNKGFTLLEALVALAIVAMLTGVCGTALMAALPGAEVSRAARTIVSMCRHARFEAIKRNEQIRFHCDMGQSVCETRVRSDNALLRRFDLAGLRDHVAPVKSFTTHYTPLGRATLAGTVTLRNSSGLSRTVTVRLSGSVVTQ